MFSCMYTAETLKFELGVLNVIEINVGELINSLSLLW